MINGTFGVYIPSTTQYTTRQNGKMSFPVRPASLVYSHFEYVSGTRAPDGSNGVDISKLKLIDALIARFYELGNRPVFHSEEASGSFSLLGDEASSYNAVAPVAAQDSTDSVDGLFDRVLVGLVEGYRTQVIDAQNASSAMPYVPAPSPQPGILFSIFG
jgi:hypothetical protein